jgi:nucleoid-associated protein YgaU
MTRLITVVKGLGSALLLAAFIVGVPAVMVRIGAFPSTVPDLPAMWQAAIRPDTGNRAVFAVLAVLVWVAWALFTLSVLREIGTAIRTRGERSARPVRGLTWSARPAEILVAAIVAVFVAAPLLGATATPAAAAGSPSGGGSEARMTPVATAAHHPGATDTSARPAASSVATPAGHTTQAAPAGPHAAHAGDTAQYTVKRRDTLWSIAERHLGDPMRYREIARLNPAIGADYEIHTGQVLTLPATPTPVAEAANTSTRDGVIPTTPAHATVENGDTLSGIAAEHGLSHWGPVWAANKGKAEPGGKHFTDPNRIEVGWDITLPTTATQQAAPTAPPQPAAVPPAAAPSATPPPAAPPPSTPIPATSAPAPQGAPGHAVPGREAQDGDVAAAAPALPTATASAAAAETTPSGSVDTHSVSTPETAEQLVMPSVAPLAAGGAVAAAGVLAALLYLRRQQFRYRRPGRSIATSGPDLVPVEKAAITVGGAAAAETARLHEVLRRIAATDIEVLDVAAVQLTASTITLHLASPATLPAPWEAVDGTQMVWRFPGTAAVEEAGADPEVVGVIAPYPALVHVGSDATSWWLLNLEQFGGLVMTGDHDRCLGLARVIAAQLGLTPWGDCIGVTLLGFGSELVDAAPDRLRYAAPADTAAVVSATVREAERNLDSMDFGLDLVQARRRAAFDEIWPPHVLLLAGDVLTAADGPAAGELKAAVAGLLQLAQAKAGRAGAVVVVVGASDVPPTTTGTTAHLGADGSLTLPGSGLTVAAAGWDEDTARGVGMLLAHARTAPDEKIPDATGEQPWHAFSDATGALRAELVLPRATPHVHDSTVEGAACSLPLADEVYLEVSATTKEDLAALAPIVPADVLTKVKEADPTLDDEVAAWFDDANPTAKLSVLGPLTLRTSQPVKGRRPYYAELAAYLVHREHGASTDQIATAFSLAPGSARKYISTLRDILGTNPKTGKPYLPNANESKSAKARGVNVYQLTGILVDAELFRRLRLRGDARGQERGGIDDYVTALSLVTGEPFSQMRDEGGAWIVGGDRIDHHATTAIIDVAHIVNMYALAAGDTVSPRAAADIARIAMPADEVHRLDLAATDAAEGRTDDVHRTIVKDVCNRSDDGFPPMELSPRTKQILAHHRDWLSRAS